LIPTAADLAGDRTIVARAEVLRSEVAAALIQLIQFCNEFRYLRKQADQDEGVSQSPLNDFNSR
jgi:hypothetical protein